MIVCFHSLDLFKLDFLPLTGNSHRSNYDTTCQQNVFDGMYLKDFCISFTVKQAFCRKVLEDDVKYLIVTYFRGT